jgi:Tfp pilus assembly protein PilX
MSRTKQAREALQGSVLIVTLCLLFIVVGLVITILDVASDHRKIAARQMNLDQAMYVAEAGVETGARFMESNLIVIVNSSTGATNGSGSVGSGSYSYFICRSNTSTYCIISTGTVNGVKRIVSLLDVYRPTYAEFSLWSSNNNAVSFATGDTFTGHVHSNTELYFSGSPAFYSALTSDYGTYSGSLSGVYLADGLTLNSYQGTMADVNFNSGSSSLKSLANLVVSGTATLTFNGGTTTVKTSSSTTIFTNVTTSWANGGAIYVANNGTTTGSKSGTIYLEGGTVTGPLTVVSEASMYVENNITYTHNPVTTPTTTDALGLISRDNIWVDTGAPTSLTIDAAMITAGTSGDGSAGSFSVINYATMTPTGTLTIYGGIVQEVRGAVGTANAGTLVSGYAKNYSYDSRFLTKPPPDYPVVSNKVNFSQWREGH